MNRRNFIVSIVTLPTAISVGICKGVEIDPRIKQYQDRWVYVKESQEKMIDSFKMGLFSKEEIESMGFVQVSEPSFVDEFKEPKQVQRKDLQHTWLSPGDLCYWTRNACISFVKNRAKMELGWLRDNDNWKYIFNVFPIVGYNSVLGIPFVKFYVAGCK